MYNRTIKANINIVTDYMVHRAPPTMHMLLSAFCLLSRWDHVGLSSSYWRWYWNDRAGAGVTYEGVHTPVGPTHAVLIPPNIAFSTHTDNPVGHLHCHFWLGLQLRQESAKPVAVKIDRETRKRLESATQSMAIDRPAYCPPLKWLAIHSILCETLSRAGFQWEIQPPDEVMDRIRQRLHHEPSRSKLSNSAIAEEYGLSINTLLRRFRLATGSSPQQYLIQLRVERAAEMLRSTNVPIEKIAQLCGFVDRYHLSRVFMKHTSVSPAAYRRAALVHPKNRLPR